MEQENMLPLAASRAAFPSKANLGGQLVGAFVAIHHSLVPTPAIAHRTDYYNSGIKWVMGDGMGVRGPRPTTSGWRRIIEWKSLPSPSRHPTIPLALLYSALLKFLGPYAATAPSFAPASFMISRPF
jgi:hypothetical protein